MSPFKLLVFFFGGLFAAAGSCAAQGYTITYRLGDSIAHAANKYFGADSPQGILATSWADQIGDSVLWSGPTGNLEGVNDTGIISSQLLTVSQATSLAISLGFDGGVSSEGGGGVIYTVVGSGTEPDGTVIVGEPYIVVTLCVNEAYSFDGAAKAAVSDARVYEWIDKMDKTGVITQRELDGVPLTVANAVIEADPNDAFSKKD